MNLTELKAKIAARKQTSAAKSVLVKQPPDMTDAKVTPNQEQIISKILSEGKSSFYHFIVHFEGLLDEFRLTAAINKVVENQIALRTEFYKIGDEWHQCVIPFSEIGIEFVDLSELPEADRRTRITELTDGLAEKTLAVFDGELFRLRLIKISETNLLLAAVVSHLCCDFASLAILNREVLARYTEPSAAANPQAINYFDYCKWIENKFTQENICEKKRFWTDYLKTAKPLFRGGEKTSEHIDETNSADHEFLDIPAQIKEKAETLTGEYPFSKEVVFLAVFVLTLYSRTGQNGFVIGTATGGRDKPELENLIGCFTNLLVFYIELKAEKNFLEFLEEVRNNILECYKHQDTPYDLIEECAPEIFSRAGISPAQTIFSANRISRQEFEIPGMKISLEMLDTFQMTGEMNFMIYADRGFFISTEYKKSIFPRDEIRQLQAEYLRLLTLFTEQPETVIGDAVALE